MGSLFYSLVAAATAVSMEYSYRRLPGPWIHWCWAYVLPAMLINYCIYKLITTPGQPMVGALIIWTFAVMGLRVFASAVLLKDTIPTGTWVALGLMVVARIAQVTWK
jgi:hypothetical protein